MITKQMIAAAKNNKTKVEYIEWSCSIEKSRQSVVIWVRYVFGLNLSDWVEVDSFPCEKLNLFLRLPDEHPGSLWHFLIRHQKQIQSL